MLSVSKIVNNRNGAFKLFACNSLRVPKRHERARNLERIGRIRDTMAENCDCLARLRDFAAYRSRLGLARVVIAHRISRQGSPRGPLADSEASCRHASRPRPQIVRHAAKSAAMRNRLGQRKAAGWQRVGTATIRFGRIEAAIHLPATRRRRKLSRKFRPPKF